VRAEFGHVTRHVSQYDLARSINEPCLARPYSYRAETGSGRVYIGWPVWTSIGRLTQDATEAACASCVNRSEGAGAHGGGGDGAGARNADPVGAWAVVARGGHFFTINRKPNRTVPNRTEISVFSVVRFGFGFCISEVRFSVS
jgi:hypothetical protein